MQRRNKIMRETENRMISKTRKKCPYIINNKRLYTLSWGGISHRWPNDTSTNCRVPIRMCSSETGDALKLTHHQLTPVNRRIVRKRFGTLAERERTGVQICTEYRSNDAYVKIHITRECGSLALHFRSDPKVMISNRIVWDLSIELAKKFPKDRVTATASSNFTAHFLFKTSSFMSVIVSQAHKLIFGPTSMLLWWIERSITNY